MLSTLTGTQTFAYILLLDAGISEKLPKLMGLFGLAFVKFALAALAAIPQADLTFWDIMASVGGGALSSVVVYTYFGGAIRAWIQKTFRRNKAVNFKRIRRTIKFWKKYGLLGTAALAPVLSPMVSVAISVAFKEKPRRIITYIGTSIIVWTIIFAFFREGVLEIIGNFRSE
ncbi:MAG: hypothetical protein R8P61_22100 [Bacteroidia bacterium]|nr:hypothetical protein [Bacteroidia bacterium]